MANKEFIEMRLKMPKKLADKLSAMANAYGVTRQSIILMLLGQTISGVETMTRALTESLTDMADIPDDKKDILAVLNKQGVIHLEGCVLTRNCDGCPKFLKCFPPDEDRSLNLRRATESN